MARRKIKARDVDLREVYVWQLPVRFYHWINATCIFILCITGYLIGNPLDAGGHLEASESYMFGVIRFGHFLFSFIFFLQLCITGYTGDLWGINMPDGTISSP